MKRTSRILLTALLLGGALNLKPVVRAEEAKPSVSDRIRDRLEEVIAVLELSDDQKLKIKEVFQNHGEKFKALREDTGMSREEKMQEFKAIQEDIDSEMKGILTTEQYAKWQGKRNELRTEATKSAPTDKMREWMKKTAEELNLTEEQKSKLKDVYQGPVERLKELRADTSLTPEQKLQEYKAIEEDIVPQLKKILTEEQFNKWQQKREEMRSNLRQKTAPQQ
jgi:Spy/CpxP family protein refolding chaperone